MAACTTTRFVIYDKLDPVVVMGAAQPAAAAARQQAPSSVQPPRTEPRQKCVGPQASMRVAAADVLMRDVNARKPDTDWKPESVMYSVWLSGARHGTPGRQHEVQLASLDRSCTPLSGVCALW